MKLIIIYYGDESKATLCDALGVKMASSKQKSRIKKFQVEAKVKNPKIVKPTKLDYFHIKHSYIYRLEIKLKDIFKQLIHKTNLVFCAEDFVTQKWQTLCVWLSTSV